MERGIQLMFKKRWPLNCKSPKEVHCHYRDLQLPSDWIHCKCHFSLCCHRSCPGISKLIQTECYLTTWDECHVLLPTSGDQMQKTSTTSSTIKHRLQHHATPVHSLSLLEKSQTIWSYTLFPSILVSRFLHAQDKKQNLHPNSVHALNHKNLIPSCCCCFTTGKKTPCPAAVVDLAKISTDVFIIQLGWAPAQFLPMNDPWFPPHCLQYTKQLLHILLRTPSRHCLLQISLPHSRRRVLSWSLRSAPTTNQSCQHRHCSLLMFTWEWLQQ